MQNKEDDNYTTKKKKNIICLKMRLYNEGRTHYMVKYRPSNPKVKNGHLLYIYYIETTFYHQKQKQKQNYFYQPTPFP